MVSLARSKCWASDWPWTAWERDGFRRRMTFGRGRWCRWRSNGFYDTRNPSTKTFSCSKGDSRISSMCMLHAWWVCIICVEVGSYLHQMCSLELAMFCCILPPTLHSARRMAVCWCWMVSYSALRETSSRIRRWSHTSPSVPTLTLNQWEEMTYIHVYSLREDFHRLYIICRVNCNSNSSCRVCAIVLALADI